MGNYPNIYHSNSPDVESWVGLLSLWMEFAKTASALPDDDLGDRWREAMPHVVTLLATSRALDEIGCLGWSEHGVALDRSEFGIKRAAAGINAVWHGEPMPEGVLATMEEALRSLEGAGRVCDVVVWEGDGEFVLPVGEVLERTLFESERAALDESDVGVGLAMPAGSVAGSGTAIGCFRGFSKELLLKVIEDWLGSGAEGCRVIGRGPGVQVYRSVDGDGTHDAVMPLSVTLPPGRPLLVPVAGLARRDSSSAAWLDQQRSAMGERKHCISWLGFADADG